MTKQTILSCLINALHDIFVVVLEIILQGLLRDLDLDAVLDRGDYDMRIYVGKIARKLT